VVHVLAAHGTEAGDYESGGTLGAGGVASSTGAHDGLGQLASGIVEALCDFAYGTALAGGFIDGSATATAQATQSEAGRTGGVGYGTAARSSGARGHAALLS
jgi:hypothetical protein